MNPYETLDVEKDATAEDIKKSYRKLAATHHPDKGGKHEDFLNVQRAYETLSDPAARARYDETGAMSDEPTMFERCMVELLRMAVHFVEQIDDTDHNDIIGIMQQNIRDALQKIHKERANTQLLIDKLTRSAKRFKTKGDKNPFQVAIEARAKNLELVVDTLDRVHVYAVRDVRMDNPSPGPISRRVNQPAMKRIDIYGPPFPASFFDRLLKKYLKVEKMERRRERTIICHRFFYLCNSVEGIAAQMNITTDRVEDAIRLRLLRR